MKLFVIILTLFAIFPTIVSSQTCIPCIISLAGDSEPSSYDSVVCINDSVYSINNKFKGKLDTSENGISILMCRGKYGNMIVNKNGKIVLWGIASLDNGIDNFNNGLVRIIRNDKWGYANINGKIVIQPKYDGALPFENGSGKVCIGCRSECVEGSNCEYHYFKGGIWYTLDTTGSVIDSSKTKK